MDYTLLSKQQMSDIEKHLMIDMPMEHNDENELNLRQRIKAIIDKISKKSFIFVKNLPSFVLDLLMRIMKSKKIIFIVCGAVIVLYHQRHHFEASIIYNDQSQQVQIYAAQDRKLLEFTYDELKGETFKGGPQYKQEMRLIDGFEGLEDAGASDDIHRYFFTQTTEVKESSDHIELVNYKKSGNMVEGDNKALTLKGDFEKLKEIVDRFKKNHHLKFSIKELQQTRFIDLNKKRGFTEPERILEVKKDFKGLEFVNREDNDIMFTHDTYVGEINWWWYESNLFNYEQNGEKFHGPLKLKHSPDKLEEIVKKYRTDEKLRSDDLTEAVFYGGNDLDKRIKVIHDDDGFKGLKFEDHDEVKNNYYFTPGTYAEKKGDNIHLFKLNDEKHPVKLKGDINKMRAIIWTYKEKLSVQEGHHHHHKFQDYKFKAKHDGHDEEFTVMEKYGGLQYGHKKYEFTKESKIEKKEHHIHITNMKHGGKKDHPLALHAVSGKHFLVNGKTADLDHVHKDLDHIFDLWKKHHDAEKSHQNDIEHHKELHSNEKKEHDALKIEQEKLRKEHEKLHTDHVALHREHKALKGSRAELREVRAEPHGDKTEISRLKGEIKEHEAKIQKLEGEAAGHKSKIHSLEQDADHHKTEADGHRTEAYRQKKIAGDNKRAADIHQSNSGMHKGNADHYRQEAEKYKKKHDDAVKSHKKQMDKAEQELQQRRQRNGCIGKGLSVLMVLFCIWIFLNVF